MEGTAKQEEGAIVGWMECDTVKIFVYYCTAGGHLYCSLIGMCYSEHYVEVTAKQLDSSFPG